MARSHHALPCGPYLQRGSHFPFSTKHSLLSLPSLHFSFCCLFLFNIPVSLVWIKNINETSDAHRIVIYYNFKRFHYRKSNLNSSKLPPPPRLLPFFSFF